MVVSEFSKMLLSPSEHFRS